MSGSADARAPSARQCAQQIVEAFARYNAEFRAITRRAPLRFDSRDSRGSQRDAVERIELYDRFVNQTIAELRQALGDAAADRDLWRADSRRVRRPDRQPPDPEFTKTFFSSISRRLFGTVGSRRTSSSWPPTLTRWRTSTPRVGTNTYINHGSLVAAVRGPARRHALPLAVARPRQQHRARRRRGAQLRCRRAANGARSRGSRSSGPVFYQISRAYIVGRIVGRRLRAAAGDRAEEHRRRRAGGCGDAVRGRRQHRLQLHALLLPRRPGARRRGGRVPEVDHAAQAGERAVHRAGPRQAGQDRALPRADAPPRTHRGPVRARRRASAAW